MTFSTRVLSAPVFRSAEPSTVVASSTTAADGVVRTSSSAYVPTPLTPMSNIALRVVSRGGSVGDKLVECPRDVAALYPVLAGILDGEDSGLASDVPVEIVGFSPKIVEAFFAYSAMVAANPSRSIPVPVATASEAASMLLLADYLCTPLSSQIMREIALKYASFSRLDISIETVQTLADALSVLQRLLATSEFKAWNISPRSRATLIDPKTLVAWWDFFDGWLKANAMLCLQNRVALLLERTEVVRPYAAAGLLTAEELRVAQSYAATLGAKTRPLETVALCQNIPPLIRAVIRQDPCALEMIETLAAEEVDCTDGYGAHVLDWSELISTDALKRDPVTLRLIEMGCKRGLQPIGRTVHEAAESGNLLRLKQLLVLGADPLSEVNGMNVYEAALKAKHMDAYHVVCAHTGYTLPQAFFCQYWKTAVGPCSSPSLWDRALQIFFWKHKEYDFAVELTDLNVQYRTLTEWKIGRPYQSLNPHRRADEVGRIPFLHHCMTSAEVLKNLLYAGIDLTAQDSPGSTLVGKLAKMHYWPMLLFILETLTDGCKDSSEQTRAKFELAATRNKETIRQVLDAYDEVMSCVALGTYGFWYSYCFKSPVWEEARYLYTRLTGE